MSAENQDVTPAVPKAPNAVRLQRMLRKHKTKVVPRPWRSQVSATAAGRVEQRAQDEEAHEDVRHQFSGVPHSLVMALVAKLSDEDKERAAAGLDPLTTVEEELARRASRFGINFSPSIGSAASFAVDEETLKRRTERFGQQVEISRTATVVLSPEDTAAMELRAKRFGTSS